MINKPLLSKDYLITKNSVSSSKFKKIYDISNEDSINSFHKIQIPFFNIRKIVHYLQVCY